MTPCDITPVPLENPFHAPEKQVHYTNGGFGVTWERDGKEVHSKSPSRNATSPWDPLIVLHRFWWVGALLLIVCVALILGLALRPHQHHHEKPVSPSHMVTESKRTNFWCWSFSISAPTPIPTASPYSTVSPGSSTDGQSCKNPSHSLLRLQPRQKCCC